MTQPTKKLFSVEYTFDGRGTALVRANTAEEAEELWRNGEQESEEEWGDTYEVDSICEEREEGLKK